PLRKYVARVSRRVSGNDVSVSLEPDDTERLEDLLTSPSGGGPSGTSERQAAFERKVIAPTRSVHAGMDDDTRYDRAVGVWKPQAGGTGKANTRAIDVGSGSINTGGGSISTGGGTVSNTGGSNVDLGTGSGIGGTGSSGVSTGGGTTGRVAEWSSSTALTA